jgi:hypothetical protein
MFDLIFALLGWNSRSPSYRYGNKSYDVDLEDGYIQQQPPSPDSVNRDYFRQNAPSALKSNSPYVPQDPYGRQLLCY